MRTDRSDDYRYQWFRKNYRQIDSEGKIRCVYCGRKFPKNKITIDHVVPVYAAQHSFFARMYLKSKNIQDVNDVNNLVPACQRCNRRKGREIGYYPLRAYLGQYDGWWVFIKIARILIIIAIVLGFWYLFH